MTPFSQLNALSVLASLEHMGAIGGETTSSQAFVMMYQHSQDLLTRIARQNERPLTTLFRLYHDHGGMCWFQHSPCKSRSFDFMRELSKTLVHRTGLHSKDVIEVYFRQISSRIEEGIRRLFLAENESWIEAYYHAFADFHLNPPMGISRRHQSHFLRLAQAANGLESLGYTERARRIQDEAYALLRRVFYLYEQVPLLLAQAYEAWGLSSDSWFLEITTEATRTAEQISDDHARAKSFARIASHWAGTENGEQADAMYDRASALEKPLRSP